VIGPLKFGGDGMPHRIMTNSRSEPALQTTGAGTFETYEPALKLSVRWGRPEVIGARPKRRFRPRTDLGAHRNVQGPEEQNRVDAKGKTPRGPCRDEFNRLSRLNENIGNSDQELWDMIA
jgi:hypothetical protein